MVAVTRLLSVCSQRCRGRCKIALEELDRQIKRAIGIGLGIGNAALAREGVFRARILVDRHQRVGAENTLQHVVDRRLHPLVVQRHVQHERPVKIRCLADVMLDIGSVIGDGAVDIGAAAQHVTKLAAKAVADAADLAGASIHGAPVLGRGIQYANQCIFAGVVGARVLVELT